MSLQSSSKRELTEAFTKGRQNPTLVVSSLSQTNAARFVPGVASLLLAATYTKLLITLDYHTYLASIYQGTHPSSCQQNTGGTTKKHIPLDTSRVFGYF